MKAISCNGVQPLHHQERQSGVSFAAVCTVHALHTPFCITHRHPAVFAVCLPSTCALWSSMSACRKTCQPVYLHPHVKDLQASLTFWLPLPTGLLYDWMHLPCRHLPFCSFVMVCYCPVQMFSMSSFQEATEEVVSSLIPTWVSMHLMHSL